METKQWDLLLKKEGFISVLSMRMEDFFPYQKNTPFDDLSYSLLYAWQFEYSYLCKAVSGNMVIVGLDIEKELFFAVLPVDYNTLRETVNEICSVLKKLNTPFKMKYISDSMRKYLNGYEMKCEKSFSDYIYSIDEFINIQGKENHSKRHEYTYVKNHFKDVRYESINESNINDAYHIFDKWCENYDCTSCVWGCEKKAFKRMMSVYDKKYCIGSIVYFGDEPVSFGVAERLNDEYVCYHIQKNARRVRGLTYYLHYHMAMEHLDVPYINWGEDMGVDGLRINKQKYHPCMMLDKYEIEF